MAPSWGMVPSTHLKNFNPELLLCKGNTWTKSGVETKGKTIQRLPHLRIHSICRHQTQTLLLIPRSASWQEPDIAVSWEAFLEPDKYRSGCLQSTIKLTTGTPMKELGEGLRESKGPYMASPLVMWRLDAAGYRNIRAVRWKWVGRWGSTLIEPEWGGMW